LLARFAVGVAAVFMETHPDPDRAPSDGPNMIPMKQLPVVVEMLLETRQAGKSESRGRVRRAAPASSRADLQVGGGENMLLLRA
jgi:hypothetical protein